MPTPQSQATTITASTAETTIVTANALFPNQLEQLIITTPNVAVATLTLRDGTAGTIRGVFDYPNAASAPGSPLVVTFNPPINQAINSNWTLQASLNATAVHVMAVYAPQ